MKKAIGLCLGGGGARGFFHIGVIRALRELKIPIKEISGCSIGAIIGGIYAADPNIKFQDIINSFKFHTLVKLRTKKPGIMNMEKVEQYLRSLIHVEEFEDLQIPLTVNATDMFTTKEIVFNKNHHSELLIPAIIASMSIPGLFPTIYNGKTALCDGGLVNLVPVSHIKARNIVISDLTFPLPIPGKEPSKLETLKAPITIPINKLVQNEIKKIKNKKRFVHLKFNRQMEMLDFRSSETKQALNEGYVAVMANKKKFLN